MLLLYLSIFAIYIILINKGYGKNNTICSAYIGIWLIVGGLSTLGLWGIDRPSEKVHLVIFVGIVLFLLGTYFGNRVVWGNRKRYIFQTVSNPNNATFQYVEKRYRKRLLLLSQLAAWIISIFYIPRTISLITSVGYFDLRYYAYTGSDLYMSTIELLFFQSVIQPLFFAGNIIYMIGFVEQRRIKLLLPVLINSALYAFMFGGREIIIFDVIVLLMQLYVNGGKRIKKILLRYKKYVLIIGVAIAVLIYLISLRKYSKFSAIDTIAIYLVGPLTFFDKLWTNGQFPDGACLGKLLLGSITSILDYINLLFVDHNAVTAIQLINDITQKYQSIGTVNFNALTTYFYPALCDFGVAGILIYPFALGAFSAAIERRYKMYNTMIYTGLFYYLLYIVLMSTMNYYMMTTLSGMFLVYLLVFCFGVKERQVEI